MSPGKSFLVLEIDIDRLHELPAVEKRADGNLDPGDPLLQLKDRDLPRPVLSVGLQHFDHVFAVRVLPDEEQALEVLGFTAGLDDISIRVAA